MYPLQCRTADRPGAPCNLHAASCTLCSVTLEFDVPCDTLQLSCVDAVKETCVEVAGPLVWTVLPAEHLRLVPPCYATRIAAPGTIHRVVTVSGLEPGMWHTLRVWVLNEVGWCRDVPPSISCHTSLPPLCPCDLRATALSPHMLLLQWEVEDPEGAPVVDCEVSVHQASLFSLWAEPATLGLRRCGRTNWEVHVCSLEAGCVYSARVRARNAVECSAWSRETTAATTGAPEVQCASLDRRSGAVEMAFSQPVGSPVVLCAARCSGTGREVLARRAGAPGRWTAHLGELPEGSEVTVRALNSVAWSPWSKVDRGGLCSSGPKGSAEEAPQPREMVLGTCLLELNTLEMDRVRSLGERLRLLWEETCNEPLRDACGSPGTLLMAHRPTPVLGVLENHASGHATTQDTQDTESVVCHGRTESVDESADDTSPKGALRHQETLLLARSQSASVLGVLESLSSLGDADDLRCRDWMDGCQVCVDKCANGGHLNLEMCVEAGQVLLEGCWWLEQLRRPVEGYWQQISNHVLCSECARALQVLAKEREIWTTRFDQQFVKAVQQIVGTAWFLLAAAEGCYHQVASTLVHQDLKRLLALRTAAEKQLKKLRRAMGLVHEVTVGEQAPRNFDQVSVLEKLSQTALGLVLTAMLPIPGTIEVGLLSISMMWLESDVAGRHVLFEHPRSEGKLALERFDQRPIPAAAALLEQWAAGKLQETVLLHNATARFMTVRLQCGDASFLSWSYSKLRQAHPFVRVATEALEKAVRSPPEEDQGLMLEPTGVVAITLPPLPPEMGPVRVEFAYGTPAQRERPIGSCPVGPDRALSFVCLDRDVHVNNSEAMVTTEESSVTESASIELVNHDFSPVTARFFPISRLGHMFAKPLLTESVMCGERKSLTVPVPEDAPKGYLHVELQMAAGKARCNACNGQVITCDGCL